MVIPVRLTWTDDEGRRRRVTGTAEFPPTAGFKFRVESPRGGHLTRKVVEAYDDGTFVVRGGREYHVHVKRRGRAVLDRRRVYA